MKRFFLSLCLLLGAFGVTFAQNGLPANPTPGKCYVRCIQPDVFETNEVTIQTRPAYKKLEVVPAEYRTEEVRLMVKPATKRFTFVPAEFEKYTETMDVEDPYNKIAITPASFGADSEMIEVEPAVSRYEYQGDYSNCASDDPRDCRVLCYVEYPAQYMSVPKQTLANDAAYATSRVGGKTINITKQRITREPSVQEVEIPAEYQTVTKRILVKDETVREIAIPAEFRTETIRVLKSSGGLAAFEEIDCGLVKANILPIYYALGSAALSGEAKKIVDDKILALMKSKPGIRVEIASHTDARGSSTSNQALSQRRAESVVSYLASRGISRNRLVAKGFGENALINKCVDGVECSEEMHRANRRTEFRVLQN